MSQSQPVLKAIEAIYDAGTDPQQWPVALGSVQELVGANFGALLAAYRGRLVTEAATPSGRPLLQVLGGDELSADNLWYQRRKLAPLNKAIAGERLATPAEIRRTRFYAEVLRPLELFHMCATALVDQNDDWAAVTFTRSEREAPYEDREIDLLDHVAPHFSRAAKIAALLQDANLYAANLEASSNRLAYGLLLINDRGRVLYANSEAERLLRTGRIACRKGGRLTARRPSAHCQLTSFLDGLALLREPTAVQLLDYDGAALKLIGSPLPARRQDFACLRPIARSVVFIFDEASRSPPPMRLIAQLYRLTPAERRLAEALLSGESLTDYSERMGLTRNTLKTQLRSLFAKTDTARQSDLVRRLTKLAAVAVG